MFNIVLFQPEIPPNTGNVIRLCANTGCRLHLIAPLGFELDDKRLRRAGLDYHEWADIKIHSELGAYWSYCLDAGTDGKSYALSTKAQRNYAEARFQPGDNLIFGPETRGLPEDLLTTFGDENVLRLPMLPQSRSLNLSNTVTAVVYEALRQQDFTGLV